MATGIKLTHHLVNIVFKIFDEDHDGKLSYKEFVGVMKERLLRGDGVRPLSCASGGVSASCVRCQHPESPLCTQGFREEGVMGKYCLKLSSDVDIHLQNSTLKQFGLVKQLLARKHVASALITILSED